MAQLIASNRYAFLNNTSNENQYDFGTSYNSEGTHMGVQFTPAQGTSASANSDEMKTRKPLLIVGITKIKDYSRYHQAVKNTIGNAHRIQYVFNIMKVYTENIEGFQNLKSVLQNRNVEFYTFTQKED